MGSVFRQDIAGLRAIAVLPVVAYHVGISLIPGGFVGVDVFFVISGYLITQLLCAELDARTFTFLRFYERRARRILPALLVMLIVTFVLAWFYCLPAQFADLARSLIAAVTSSSNFYFWATSGYFEAGNSGVKPLLHTWSLAVEEQFYLLWPVLLLLGRRYFQRRLLAITIILAVLSLVVSAVGAFGLPIATFYSPFTRAWELGVGALLAMGAVPDPHTTRQREWVAALGLTLIVGSIFLIRPTLPFPGLLAVPPCLGAACIIAAGRSGPSRTARLLAMRPLTFIGAISYSLYLWHWPITVFQVRYAFLRDGLSHPATKILIVAVSLAAAALSYQLIEQPFRTTRLRPSARSLAKLATGAIATLIALGVTATAQDGFPNRFTAEELRTVRHLNNISHDSWRSDTCFLYDDRGSFRLADACLAIDPTRRNYLLLGDSHAAELYRGLALEYPGINFLQASASGCFPTLTHEVREDAKCARLMDEILRVYLSRVHIDNLIIAARWKASVLPSLSATVSELKQRGVRVTLIGPTSSYDAPMPQLVIGAMRASDPNRIWRHRDPAVQELDGQLRELAARDGVAYISLLELECHSYPCAATGSPWPEIFDDEHFNETGSAIVAREIRRLHTDFGG